MSEKKNQSVGLSYAENVEKNDQVNDNNSQRKKYHASLSAMIISSMMLALAVVFKALGEVIPIFNMPMGGSISLAMLPLVLCALFCGPIWGISMGVVFGLIDFFWDGVIGWTSNGFAVFLSFLLDYCIGFGACGLAAIFRKPFYQKKSWAPITGLVLTAIVRFISSFFSGLIVFNQIWSYSGPIQPDFSLSGVLYSLGYNAGYLFASLALCAVVMVILLKPIFIVQDTNIVKPLARKYETSNDVDKLPSIHKLVPFYLAFIAVFGIISTIPNLKFSFVGYIGGSLAILLIAYLIIDLVNNAKKGLEIYLDIVYLSIAVALVGVNLCGILSAYTYGIWAYIAEE